MVAETSQRFRRTKLLPAQVEIMLAVGDLPAARDAADELTAIANAYATPALRAMADHARGAVLLTEGDPQAALVALRVAWQALRRSSLGSAPGPTSPESRRSPVRRSP